LLAFFTHLLASIMIVQSQTQTQVAVTELAAKLTAGDRLTQDVVIELMSYIFGGGAATGRWNWKQATDLIEAAMVSSILTGSFTTIEDFMDLQALVPHHQIRSEEQIQLQQFSTPLSLAWIVARKATPCTNPVRERGFWWRQQLADLMGHSHTKLSSTKFPSLGMPYSTNYSLPVAQFTLWMQSISMMCCPKENSQLSS
jgi:hypothetical protein